MAHFSHLEVVVSIPSTCLATACHESCSFTLGRSVYQWCSYDLPLTLRSRWHVHICTHDLQRKDKLWPEDLFYCRTLNDICFNYRSTRNRTVDVSVVLVKEILERGPKCVGAFVVIIITCWDIDFLLFETFFRKRLKNNCLPFLEIFLHMGLWEVDRFSKLCWFAGPLGSFAFFNLLGCRNDCQVHDRHKEEKHGHSFPSTTVMRISSTCQQRLVLVRSYKSVNFLRVLWQRKFCLCFEYWFVTW